ncbi:MAG: hypothetical protein HQK67_01975 [Desulfamplus sp.]|nr:hypothetical protein [Desulfamplus sp.]
MIKKKKTCNKHKSDGQELKMSEMLTQVAYDYIIMGKTHMDKQNYLNIACIAWNIALLTEEKRQLALDQCQKQYELRNPYVNDSQNLRYNMELLIQEKLRLFPNVNRTIVNANIISPEVSKATLQDKNREQLYIQVSHFLLNG